MTNESLLDNLFNHVQFVFLCLIHKLITAERVIPVFRCNYTNLTRIVHMQLVYC